MITPSRRARDGRRRLWLIVWAVVVCGILQPPTTQADTDHGAPLLDGYRFLGATGAEHRDADQTDFVQFVDGRFFSAGCARWGFGDAAYEAWREGDSVRFRAVTTSPDTGQLEWNGAVRGARIEATYVWTKKRLLWTTRRAYWLRGTRTDAANPYEPAH